MFHYTTFSMGMSHLRLSFKLEGEMALHQCKYVTIWTVVLLLELWTWLYRKRDGSSSITRFDL